jgi:hypothetical protein
MLPIFQALLRRSVERMPRYIVETPVPDASGECLLLEWRIRAVVGELRRKGMRILFDRAVQPPEEGRCLIFLQASTSIQASLAAERACLNDFRVIEADQTTAGE